MNTIVKKMLGMAALLSACAAPAQLQVQLQPPVLSNGVVNLAWSLSGWTNGSPVQISGILGAPQVGFPQWSLLTSALQTNGTASVSVGISNLACQLFRGFSVSNEPGVYFLVGSNALVPAGGMLTVPYLIVGAPGQSNYLLQVFDSMNGAANPLTLDQRFVDGETVSGTLTLDSVNTPWGSRQMRFVATANDGATFSTEAQVVSQSDLAITYPVLTKQDIGGGQMGYVGYAYWGISVFAETPRTNGTWHTLVYDEGTLELLYTNSQDVATTLSPGVYEWPGPTASSDGFTNNGFLVAVTIVPPDNGGTNNASLSARANFTLAGAVAGPTPVVPGTPPSLPSLPPLPPLPGTHWPPTGLASAANSPLDGPFPGGASGAPPPHVNPTNWMRLKVVKPHPVRGWATCHSPDADPYDSGTRAAMNTALQSLTLVGLYVGDTWVTATDGNTQQIDNPDVNDPTIFNLAFSTDWIGLNILCVWPTPVWHHPILHSNEWVTNTAPLDTKGMIIHAHGNSSGLYSRIAPGGFDQTTLKHYRFSATNHFAIDGYLGCDVGTNAFHEFVLDNAGVFGPMTGTTFSRKSIPPHWGFGFQGEVNFNDANLYFWGSWLAWFLTDMDGGHLINSCHIAFDKAKLQSSGGDNAVETGVIDAMQVNWSW
ncbi:MAG: hypothetical protein WCO56_10290 [Verrucomicrobiota bacterium]